MARVTYCLSGHFVGIANPSLGAGSRGQLRAMMAQEEHAFCFGPSGVANQKRLPAFCATCGASNISACQHCKASIEVDYPGGTPGYCGGCGKPFPWTETALSAAKDYTDELDQLTLEEKAMLKATFDDLTTDTAKTPLAASRFKRIVSKIGPAAGDIIKKIIVSVATEAAKKGAGF